jgi:hypothetical protein
VLALGCILDRLRIVHFNRSNSDRADGAFGLSFGTIAALLDAGSLTSEPTQIVELSATHNTTSSGLDLINTGRVQEEGTLNSYTMCGYAAHCEVGIDTTFAAAHDNTLEDLDTFAGSLDYLYAHTHGVAYAEIWCGRLQHGGRDGIYCLGGFHSSDSPMLYTLGCVSF